MAASAKIDGQENPVSSSASIDGQDKVIATAQQIIKSLATDKSAAEDMLRILSGFDNRFSSINHLFPSSTSDAAADRVLIQEVDDDDDHHPHHEGADHHEQHHLIEEEEDELSEIEIRLEEAERLISRWDSDSLLFESSADDRFDYLSAVDDAITIAADVSAPSDVRSKAEVLIQIAMARLEDEFRHLMIRNTSPLDAAGLHGSMRRTDSCENNEQAEEDLDDNSADNDDSSSSSHHHHQRQESTSIDEKTCCLSISEEQREIDLIHPEAVADLREIAERMIAAEYHKELCQVYSSVRRDTLDECLSVLGVDRMSIEEVQKIEWKILDDKMRKWIQALRVVVKVLLSGERRLCETIFALSEELIDECFTESSKGCVMQLLNFGDAIAIGRRSSEKLFRILDMYDVLLEVMPELKELFGSDFVIVEADDILVRLGEAVRGTINEFANAVQKETSRRALPSGDIHPLTRYVMNYVKLLVEYSGSLDSLLDDGDFDGNDDADSDESRSPLGCRLRLLISYLESNLEEKMKLYEDAALQFIFLMNNRLYIIQKVKGSDLGKFLGENWVRKRRGQIRQYHNSYLRASWTRALSFLKDDGMGGGGSGSGSGSGSIGGASRVTVKDRFKNFNLAFEEIYRTQTTWKVPDPQLREELRLSTSEKIIPAYRSFMGRFGNLLETARHANKYIKYTPEDLESHLLELFEGTTALSNHPRRKLSS
ncbi:exocyst complex component EXO70B1 [Iris pallida]|uniref:Exocyst subunit Exo70 family protein n=1 Tax=Iris pallida TaxID=29817 RepID=A0AAX6HG57_IRIPA|nr:exocyst complex component EXO70B1 [Iris pallida]